MAGTRKAKALRQALTNRYWWEHFTVIAAADAHAASTNDLADGDAYGVASRDWLVANDGRPVGQLVA